MEEVDCTALQQQFDEAVEKSTHSFLENPDSLCYGLNLGVNLSQQSPVWAVGRLLHIESKEDYHLFTFGGFNRFTEMTFILSKREAAAFEVGKYNGGDK